MDRRAGWLVVLLLACAACARAQRFTVETVSDSLSFLVLTTDSTTDGRYVVLEHEWRRFGLGALRFLACGVSLEDALSVFPP